MSCTLLSPSPVPTLHATPRAVPAHTARRPRGAVSAIYRRRLTAQEPLRGHRVVAALPSKIP